MALVMRAYAIAYTFKDRSRAVAGVYEYWEHGSTGRVWAVKLNRGSVVGVIEIDRRDVNADLLPFLSYHTDEAVKGQYDETGEKLVKQADEHVTAS